MKKINKKWLSILLLIIALSIMCLWPYKANGTKKTQETTKEEVSEVKKQIGPVLSHRQEVWRYVLEWCECRGDHGAINPKDKDGTPSYYAFQFKPGTFKYYGELYEVIPKDLKEAELMESLKSYELQKAIVGYMILDPKINWLQQFPDCVRKNGLPPKE